ncbi:MAG: hypothetical protein QM532_03220 [Cyanobium sp. MAG06]|nr:hypothetical protein [Cyanobium sp. MAG06]
MQDINTFVLYNSETGSFRDVDEVDALNILRTNIEDKDDRDIKKMYNQNLDLENNSYLNGLLRDIVNRKIEPTWTNTMNSFINYLQQNNKEEYKVIKEAYNISPYRTDKKSIKKYIIALNKRIKENLPLIEEKDNYYNKLIELSKKIVNSKEDKQIEIKDDKYIINTYHVK